MTSSLDYFSKKRDRDLGTVYGFSVCFGSLGGRRDLLRRGLGRLKSLMRKTQFLWAQIGRTDMKISSDLNFWFLHILDIQKIAG